MAILLISQKTSHSYPFNWYTHCQSHGILLLSIWLVIFGDMFRDLVIMYNSVSFVVFTLAFKRSNEVYLLIDLSCIYGGVGRFIVTIVTVRTRTEPRPDRYYIIQTRTGPNPLFRLL